jgi:[FeFe] hydrogenase H-cluster maturation GTPase HydF
MKNIFGVSQIISTKNLTSSITESRKGKTIMSELNSTPKGYRLHIGIAGRRNAGKSSLMNALAGQVVAIVSPTPGTTTDPVQKALELLPFGPVLLIDTAGYDDSGDMGDLRVARTRQIFGQMDMLLLVVEGDLNHQDLLVLEEWRKKGLPVIVVYNKADQWSMPLRLPVDIPSSKVSCLTGEGMSALKELIIKTAQGITAVQLPLVAGLAGPGDLVLMVVPIDLEAPKGRLILPQVQTLRELLDLDVRVMAFKERELLDVMKVLKQRPKLVITDSQVIQRVAAEIPRDIPITGFSVLFARAKGDLAVYAAGAQALDRLRPGDRILVSETCAHHVQGDDIGRVKIPRWVRQYTGMELTFEHSSGPQLPEELSGFAMIIQCGGCMTNRRTILQQIAAAQNAGIPISNYGLVIAKAQGLLQRMLSPFPGMQELALEGSENFLEELKNSKKNL